jgi:SulP family sulfate permease
VLSSLGVYDQLATEHHLFDTTPEAIAHARVHAARLAHDPHPRTSPHDPSDAVGEHPHSEREIS